MIEKNKLLGLEVVRFLAAGVVLFVHYHFLCDIGVRYSLSPITLYPFYNSFSFIYSLAVWAVRAFWCISGFIFFWKYHTLISDRVICFKDFFMARFARLYPLHILTFFLVVVGQAIYFRMAGLYFLNDVRYSTPYFVAQLFMASNRVFKEDSFNWPVWSVSIEVAVYLLFFLAIRYFSKSIRFNLFIIVICVVLSLFAPQTPYSLLFECLMFFYLGGTAAILKKYALLNNVSGWFAWKCLIAGPLIFWFIGGFSSSNLIYVFWAVWLSVLMYCISDDYKASGWVRTSIENLGNMTYASYLIHIPVQLLLAIICFRWKILLPLFNPLCLIAYVCLILVLSYLTYKHFELPMKQRIHSASKAIRPQSKKSYCFIFTGVAFYLYFSFSPSVAAIFDRNNTRYSRPSSSRDDHAAVGRSLLASGNYSQAIEAYQKNIKRYPYDPHDYANIGISYFLLGDYGKAIETLDKVIAINPNYFLAYNIRSRVNAVQGRYDLSIDDLHRAMAVDPCPDRLLKRSFFHREARPLSEPQTSMCLSSAEAYFNLGSIHIFQGDYDEAIVNLDKAIRRNPDYAKAYERRAVGYYHKKNYDLSYADVQRAEALGLKLDSALVEALRLTANP